jgi:hypothetical protein
MEDEGGSGAGFYEPQSALNEGYKQVIKEFIKER